MYVMTIEKTHEIGKKFLEEEEEKTEVKCRGATEKVKQVYFLGP